MEKFTERELRLIQNCMVYTAESPAGLPGHNLMVIIAKLVRSVHALGEQIEIEEEEGNQG